MSIYEYTTKSNVSFLNNSTVISIKDENESIVKLIDKISINDRANKYKILLLKNDSDLIKFNKLYAFFPIPNNSSFKEKVLNWDLVSKKYGGIAFVDDFWTYERQEKFRHHYTEYGWINSNWWTEYCYLWRFKIK